MKIVLDNIIFSNVTNGGVSNYWFEMIKFLKKNDKDDLFFIDQTKGYENFHRKQLNFSVNEIKTVKTNLFSRVSKIKLETNAPFLYHSSYYRPIKSNQPYREVTTIHDFIHNFHAPFLKKIAHNRIKFDSIKRSNGIICVSKNTYSDMMKFCPAKKNQKVEVIYVGVSDDYFPIENLSKEENSFLKKHEIEQKSFLLFIGNRTNYKNFDFVIKLLENDKNLKLVTVGGGVFTKEELLKIKNNLSQIIQLFNLDNKNLNILYNSAIALIYPSKYEGFGIPIIEAMKANCVVIGYRQPIIEEIAGNAAILLDNLSISEFENSINKLNQSSTYKKELLELGLENAKKYSWEKCVKETREFYDLVSSPSL
jgi:mannosyltransferase